MASLPMLATASAMSQIEEAGSKDHLHALAKPFRVNSSTDLLRTSSGIASAKMPRSPNANGASAARRGPDGPQFDLVIRNGRVIDPETKLDRLGMNVGISRGTIVTVSSEPLSGRKEIDATGLVVAPGFIDLISYDPNPLGARNKIKDGVTTNLAMHGGASDPISWYGHYKRLSPTVNYGASFYYTQARNRLRISVRDPASARQIHQLVEMAEAALQHGALGVSFSLEYVPGISPQEILPLMRLAKQYEVPVFFHARYSTMEGPGTNIDALKEIIDDARATGAAVHIDHINSTGGTFSIAQSLRMLQGAREEGLDITTDTYPYDFWATYLNSARFDPGWQRRFGISYGDLQLGGSSERLTKDSFERYRRQGKLAAAYAIPEGEVEQALRCPFVMIASDGILEAGFNNHPRSSGTFARTIAVYVREKGVLTLMEALEKMTILPARLMEKGSLAFKKKGRLSPGADADIVIFDYDRIADRATVEHPEYPSTGIEYVIVGGAIALGPQGTRIQLQAGQALQRQNDTVLALGKARRTGDHQP